MCKVHSLVNFYMFVPVSPTEIDHFQHPGCALMPHPVNVLTEITAILTYRRPLVFPELELCINGLIQNAVFGVGFLSLNMSVWFIHVAGYTSSSFSVIAG